MWNHVHSQTNKNLNYHLVTETIFKFKWQLSDLMLSQGNTALTNANIIIGLQKQQYLHECPVTNGYYKPVAKYNIAILLLKISSWIFWSISLINPPKAIFHWNQSLKIWTYQ